MSDTHSHCANIRQAVEVFNKNRVSRCLHAGDILSPHAGQAFRALRCPLDLVFGNNDSPEEPLIRAFSDIGVFHHAPFGFEIEGRRFLMMHEPIGLDAIADVRDYDCIIYGHTHRHDIRIEADILIVNPGEVCGYFTGIATVVLLEVPGMKAKLVTLEGSDEVDIFL